MQFKSVNHKIILGLIGLGMIAVLGGCEPNLNGVNAYKAAETPNPAQTYVMDPGSYAGDAYGSGGTKPGTSYGTGAKGNMDGNKAHYKAMEEVRGTGPVDWTKPNPHDNHPLPAGQGN